MIILDQIIQEPIKPEFPSPCIVRTKDSGRLCILFRTHEDLYNAIPCFHVNFSTDRDLLFRESVKIQRVRDTFNLMPDGYKIIVRNDH